LEHATEIPVVVYSADAREESAVEVAHRGAQDYLIKGQTTHKQLVRAIQLALARHPWRKRHHDWNVVSFGSSRLRPQWNEGKRELTVGGVLVKSFHQTSRNQSAILAAFEEEGWPMRIDDPLRQLGDVDPKERLRATIKSLNRHQQSQLLRFAADGTGEGIQWHFLNVQDRALTTSTG
jgi:DNA-binding NarL/FixJ family response regulator